MGWIIGAVLEGALGLFILLSILSARRKGTGKLSHYSQSGIDRFVLPVGERITALLEKGSRSRPGEKERTGASKKRLGLSTVDEVEEESYFHCRAWGNMVLSLFLCGLVALVSFNPFSQNKAVTEEMLTRPDYGKGNRKETVSFILHHGAEEIRNSVTITIPEKEPSKEEVWQTIQESLNRLETEIEGQVATNDLTLPHSVEGVLLQYKSLNPSVMRSDGHFLISPGKNRQEVRLLVKAYFSDKSDQRIMTFHFACEEDLDLSGKAKWLLRSAKEEIQVTEDRVILPSQAGKDTITWEKGSDTPKRWILVVLLLIPPIVFVKESRDRRGSAKRKEEKILAAYPDFIWELCILMGAGSSLRNAWLRLSADYEQTRESVSDPLMEEVRKVSLEMEKGASMREALEHFADRIHLRDISRFVSLLSQNIRRGDILLLSRLKELTEEAWEKRKNEVTKRTEEADTKLLIPLMMMLVVILIIVLTPSMMTIGI